MKIVNIRKEKYDVYIGRAGHGQDGYFGNPFVLGKDGNRKEVLEKYKVYFYNRIKNDPEFKSRIERLAGLTLGCFCVPLKCHGHIIIEYLNSIKKEDKNYD
jgi:hypothetical protein